MMRGLIPWSLAGLLLVLTGCMHPERVVPRVTLTEPLNPTSVTSVPVDTNDCDQDVNVPDPTVLESPVTPKIASLPAESHHYADLRAKLLDALRLSSPESIQEEDELLQAIHHFQSFIDHLDVNTLPGTPEPVCPSQPYDPAPEAQDDASLQLKLPETLRLLDLIELVGRYLDLDYVFDEKDLKNQVISLRVQGPMKVKELYPMLESILKFRGLVMSRQGHLVTIVSQDKALDIDPVLVDDQTESVAYGNAVITRVFRLHHIDAATAQSLLTEMKLGMNLTAIDGIGTLIVTGFTYRMARIEQLIDMIDVPGPLREVRFCSLHHTLAESMVKRIETLAPQMGSVSVSVGSLRNPAAKTGRPIPPRISRASAPRPSVGSAKTDKLDCYLEADERTNRILMIGLVDQLDTLESLIQDLDVPEAGQMVLRSYHLSHISAAGMKKRLTELPLGGPKHKIARYEVEGQEPVDISENSWELFSAEPQIMVLESTNSLMITATKLQHRLIQQVIASLDVPTLEQTIPYELYRLENQDPEDLAEILEKLIQQTVGRPDAKTETKVQDQDQDIVIVPDKNTFSLIVYASPQNQQWIQKLIQKLDKRRPQVLIDLTLVEISRNDSFSYDLDLVSKMPRLAGSMEVLDALYEPDGQLPGHTTLEASMRKGLGTGYYGDRHIQALVKLMESKGYGRVLARPKILVNDNEAGSINTKDTTYIETKAASVIQGVSEAIETSVKYDPYDAGIELEITPHISEGKLLRLDVSMNRSDFTNVSGTKPPDSTSSDIKTVVTVPDGSTVILGGLTKLNQSKGASKVPILGDLPLLGVLFRSSDQTDIQKRLYVFIKAEIVRPEGLESDYTDLDRISEGYKTRYETEERNFQDHSIWPGSQPQIMAPKRILEHDRIKP